MAVVRAAREDAIACRQADRGGQGQGQRRARLKVSRHLRLGDVVTGTGGVKSLPSKLEVFRGVSAFPIRVKCATLSWHAMKQALETYGHTDRRS